MRLWTRRHYTLRYPDPGTHAVQELPVEAPGELGPSLLLSALVGWLPTRWARARAERLGLPWRDA